MQAAWKEVLDPANPINWVLFGYEGTSFDLKLISKGEDGVEEMMEDLNANKIMYAFCMVEDPKTSLPKYVLLHWQGESAPGTRKGICSTHLRDISNYFRGSHITFNARNEDEVSMAEILEKVAKASATTYNFKEKPVTAMEEAPAPVGSTHQRIIPEKELPNLSERERFWNEEQSREKARVAEERQRKMSENAKLEEERANREREDSKRRDREVNERERKISLIREESKAKEEKERAQLIASSSGYGTNDPDDQERIHRSENMRRERNEEARKLISQRSTAEAKAVFERNSSAGQLNFKKPPAPKQIPANPVEPTPPPVLESNAKPEANDVVVPPPPTFDNSEQLSSQPSPPPPIAEPEEASAIISPPDVTSAAVVKPDIIQDIPVSNDNAPDVTASSSDELKAQVVGELGLCAVALYDYQAADDTEISFDPNQVITNIDQIDPGWWQGLGPDGNYGLFPANYVEVVDAAEVAQLKKS